MKTSTLVKAKYQEKQKNLRRTNTLERFSELLKVPKKKAKRKNTYVYFLPKNSKKYRSVFKNITATLSKKRLIVFRKIEKFL